MADLARTLICAAPALVDGGLGIRFYVIAAGVRLPAFAVRYRGEARAFINRCAHLAVELDWQQGHFFALNGLSLVCATHGARYHPHSGACVSGRCSGNGLVAIPLVEIDNRVCLAPHSDFILTD